MSNPQHPKKRTQISLHVDETLRQQLEVAAKSAVRTLSGEITYRLQRSLECDRQPDSDAAA